MEGRGVGGSSRLRGCEVHMWKAERCGRQREVGGGNGGGMCVCGRHVQANGGGGSGRQGEVGGARVGGT